MLEGFLKLHVEVTTTLVDPKLAKKAPEIITGTEVQILGELMTMLRYFKELSDNFVGDKYISISEVIPKINYVKASLETMNVTSPIIMPFKYSLLNLLNVKFKNLELHNIHATGMLLDPR